MTDIEQELLKLVSDLRAENAGLLEIILTQQGLLEQKVIVPEAPGGHIGREPWYIKKTKLERLSRVGKPAEMQLSSSNLEEKEIKEDAS